MRLTAAFPWGALAATTLILSSAAAAPADAAGTTTKAAHLLTKLHALKEPKWAPTVKNYDAYVTAYYKRKNAYTEKRNALIWKIYLSDPQNPQLRDLMYARWVDMDPESTDPTKHANLVESDIRSVLSKNPSPAVEEAALAARTYVDAFSRWKDVGRAKDDVYALLGKYPKTPFGPRALMLATYTASEADKPILYRKFLDLYPHSERAWFASGGLRQTEEMGKPFHLRFTDAITGKAWDTDQQKGKVVLVDFWATWCGPCCAELPGIKALYRKYQSQGFEVVGVSEDFPQQQGGLHMLKDYVAKQHLPWPEYYQGGNSNALNFSGSWGITGIPCSFLIDKKGCLRLINPPKLENSIAVLLRE